MCAALALLRLSREGETAMDDIKITINGKEIKTQQGRYILDVALENGIEIPHLCYDSRLEPYGACGLCMIEVEGSRKLLRACATKAADGMVISTDTERVTATRKTALKLLASDHRGDCRPPCVIACPGHTDCQGYVGLIANGQFEEAAKLIKDVIPLPASIGRICPHPCETACRRQNVEEPISIAALKAFAGDNDLKNGGFVPKAEKPTGKSIAVVGAGPAGLTCAYFLAKAGHKVTVFEAMPSAGGMLRYGIPQYRLPKEILDLEIGLIEKMDVEIKFNTKIGRNISLESLRKEYNAVFMGIGAWKSSSMRCKGEDKKGVLGGIDFLREVAMKKTVGIGDKVLVVGGGNTAMDVARTAVRLGACKVSVLYRRTREEMPAEDSEIEEAMEEGVEFKYLVAPSEVLDDGEKASGLRCQKMKLGEPDASGRRKPVPTGEEITFEADTIIAAIGQQVNIGEIEGLCLTKRGTIEVSEDTFETNINGVFAGGDVVTGPKIAIGAIAQGKQAAGVIDSYLKGNIKPYFDPICFEQDDLTKEDFEDKVKEPRVLPHTADKDMRKKNFRPVSETMTAEEAKKEASRCLECGCRDYYDCQLLKYIREYDIDVKAINGEKHKRKETDAHVFIERNADKCILCGLCVRACDEIMGITALGLVDRGFKSIVKPEFGLPLSETDCISCGQCAAVCPTGACMGKQAVKKQVPLKFSETKTTCGYCGVGCSLALQCKGDLLYNAVPDDDSEERLLCSHGRFGIRHVNDDSRLTDAFVKINGIQERIEIDEAIRKLAEKLKEIKEANGRDSVAFAVSPRITNEEAYLLKKAAEKLDTDMIGSFSFESDSGLKEILGYDGSTADYDDISQADLILSFGHVYENHPVMGVKIKNAAKSNAKLVSVSGVKTQAQDWAYKSFVSENSADILKSFAKALIEAGYADEKSKGFAEFNAYVQNSNIPSKVVSLAKLYGKSKKPLTVIDEDTITGDAVKLLADIAVMTGNKNGILVVRAKNNTQGILDLGINKTACEIVSAVNSGKVKALISVGEDIGLSTFRKPEFAACFDMFVTECVSASDLIIPIGSFAESDGTFTRSDGKIGKVAAAIAPKLGKSNFEIFGKLAQALDIESGSFTKISKKITGKQKEKSESQELIVPAGSMIFRDKIAVDTVEKYFSGICK